MRILFVSHSSQLDGAERSLIELIREAASRGHSGVVTIPSRGPLETVLKSIPSRFEVLVVPTRLWMGSRFWFPVSLVRFAQCIRDVGKFIKLMKEREFDVVVANSSVIPQPMIAARITKLTSVLILRESVLTNGSLKTFLPRRLVMAALSRGYSQIIAISSFVKSQVAHDVKVIPPQISDDFFAHSAFQPIRSISDNTLKAVMVGTLSKEKGQLDVVRAMAIAKSAGVSITLEIFGTGKKSFIRRLERQIMRCELNGIVILRGSTNNSLGAFQKADFSFICSRNEAFGKTSAESLLSGTPVIGYACGATPEIVTANFGLLVEPAVSKLAAALIEIGRNREYLMRWSTGEDVKLLREKLAGSAQRVLIEVEATAG